MLNVAPCPSGFSLYFFMQSSWCFCGVFSAVFSCCTDCHRTSASSWENPSRSSGLPVSLLLSCLAVVDLWNGHDHFVLPCWTSASVLRCFGTGWQSLQPCFIPPRTSPCLCRSPLVCLACCWLCFCPACCWLCSCACCWLCSSRFFSSFLPSRRWALLCERIVALLRSSRHKLVGCGSFCTSLSPLALWLWLCLWSSPETLCGKLHFPGCLPCTSNTTIQHCALRGRWLAVGARAPRSCSLQQRVLLTVRIGLGGSLPLRSVGGFQHHSCTTVWFSGLCPPS